MVVAFGPTAKGGATSGRKAEKSGASKGYRPSTAKAAAATFRGLGLSERCQSFRIEARATAQVAGKFHHEQRDADEVLRAGIGADER